MYPNWMIDFYKVGHVQQYPSDVTQVWSNWTPRASRVECNDGVVFFGLQAVLQDLLETWEEKFFQVPIELLLQNYREVIAATLGVKDPYTKHLEQLHAHGRLPLDVWAIPEGHSVPLRVPMFVISNSTPDTFWLPNFLETILSNMLWKGCTSATTARRYRNIFLKYAKEAGETDFSFVDWQGHDFSFRGMSGLADACMSGMGHLLSFSGTDTIPAILAAQAYYDAPLTVGGSVPATEHSVMCAGGAEDEFGTFLRLLTETYPTGIVSVVSDTWDLWTVLTKYIPALKDVILKRDGKLVIRPDSGDPEDIICGSKTARYLSPEYFGAARLLAQALGVMKGTGNCPSINKGGLIYGDSITPERAENIMHRMVHEVGLSPYTVVLGIGSYTYEYVTRDTYGFAMKATAVRRGDKVVDIFKKPVTDTGMKNSLVGIPAVYRTEESTEEKPVYFAVDKQKPEALDNCAFRKVLGDGKLLIRDDFETIRRRVRA